MRLLDINAVSDFKQFFQYFCICVVNGQSLVMRLLRKWHEMDVFYRRSNRV